MPLAFMGDGFMSLVAILSVLSGIGSYLQGHREGRLRNGLIDLLTEVIFALIAGLATGYVSEAYEVKRGFTCALVLILSNNATETLGQLKMVLLNRVAKHIGDK